jgi:cell wall-associated NlpC family hydrolase
MNGWPNWVWNIPYDGSAHPQAEEDQPLMLGANCQRYAYAVLGLFGITTPPHRSDELWADDGFEHVELDDARPLDLVLFNYRPEAWGAHVAVVMADDQLLHLSAEVGYPAAWSLAEFASRARYRSVAGVIRAR